ncbi:MAG TPA: hypothetical protein VKP11_09775, partial [Frankiaceae bacterium]|nr:hypothetical protein [Frankiaceae bacterium]
AGVVAYLQRADLARLRVNHPGVPDTAGDAVRQPLRTRLLTPARAALAFVTVMVVLSPIGLLAPGGAFGEAAPADLDLKKYGLSTIPKALEKYNGWWSHTLLGGYGFNSGDHPTVGYVVSAVVGTAVVATAIFLVGTLVRLVLRRRGHRPAAGPGEPGGSGGPRERGGSGEPAAAEQVGARP